MHPRLNQVKAIMMQPSEEQQDIINTGRDTIVVSNPGTGKTTTLSLRVMKLLEDKVDPEDILCITFTDKAKKEMFDAIYEMGKGKFPAADIMKINIHTFHSFAYGYLRDAGWISGEIVGNNLMRLSILNSFEQNKALNYEKDYVISQIVPKTENAIRYIKSFGITPDKIDIKKAWGPLEERFDEKSSTYTIEEMKAFLRYFVDAYSEYEESKCDAVDYNDMLLIFLEKFRGDRFEHVLVDEMQDMNEIEAEIVTRVAKSLFLVGDAKQAIFGFQGGSVKNFQKFMKTCEPKLLSTNRRSSQQILNYSKKYFLERTKDKKEFQDQLNRFNSNKTGENPKVISTDAYLSRILDAIKENPNKTVGIITRTNGQIIKISKFLDTNNIGYTSTSSKATTLQAKNEIQRYIRGLLSDRMEDKIAAAFTVFAPYSLKEAFEFSRALRAKDHERLSKMELGEIKLSKDDLDRIFATKILPNCVSKGAEWMATAMSVKQNVDEYLTLEAPTLEGLFDFIVIGEESYVERSSGSNITLTTVHKAKGRDFDVVVYIPSVSKRTSFIDVIVKSILSSCEIDVEEEIEEESLRVDFVAFTRAKEKLTVVADGKTSEDYHIEDLSTIEVDDSKDAPVATHASERLSEAYSLFVAGRFLDSQKLLKDDGAWLEKYIEDYFENIDRLSYSSITTEPYQFFKRNIIKLPYVSAGTDLGNSAHKALQKILTDQAKIEDYDGKIRKATQNGLDAIDELRKELPGLKVNSTEKRHEILLGSMTDYPDDKKTILFTGSIDTIFKHDEGYLIVDYKTDKNSKNAFKHNRQLAVYKKMLSISEGIPEDRISTRVIFVALRGGIDTGKFDRKTSKGTRNVYPTFEGHLQKVLEWKRDPKKFISELLEKESEEPLYQTIKEKLTKSATA